MELVKLTSECYDAIVTGIKEAVKSELDYASAKVDTEAGFIELYSRRNDYTEAIVNHDDNERDHSGTNLDEFLTKRLDSEVDWIRLEEEVEADDYDVWNAHGFADESDYYNYKF